MKPINTLIFISFIIVLAAGGIYFFAVSFISHPQTKPSPTPTPTILYESLASPSPTLSATPHISPSPSLMPTRTPIPSPISTPTEIPLPQPQLFYLEADDRGFYPSNTLIVKKGIPVSLIFTVRTTNVYYGGLAFRSSQFSDALARPGQSVTVAFTAHESFIINSYWPASNVFKAALQVIVN